MKKLLLARGFCGLAWQAQAQAPSLSYHYKVDLNAVKDDKLTVSLEPKDFNAQGELRFYLPKMVPGTYSIYDFGRFVSNFKALDANGKELAVQHPDDNSWVIAEGAKLARIEYQVEDSWDTEQENVVFEPAGTNIDAENEVFVFNNHGIFGFFDDQERRPFTIEIDRPKNLFGGTSMERVAGDEDTDVFRVADYHKLVDAPIMYAEADTVIIKVGNADVLIQTYSPTGMVKSKDLVQEIQPILESQRAYLGGKLPVDHYAFLIFLNEGGQSFLSGSAGALEHSYSSFYCLFEGESGDIAQTVRDVAAHEFFHIVTPLSIHSEEIHYFDYIEPEMSEHLWLYEGVTEYSAQHVQVKQRLVSAEHFLNEMSTKMATADYFKKDLPFTEMSKTCLDENKDQYPNVYMQGALIGMCIDLKLRILSKGAYGIQEMMQDLAKKYGIQKPFKDAELFDEMVAVSGYPEIKEFMLKHVAGTEPLPYVELMKEAGIEYSDQGFRTELSLLGFNPNGGIGFNPEQGLLMVANEKFIDDFGKELGLKEGDMLKKWDGEELTPLNAQQVLTSYASKAKEGYELEVLVLREETLSKRKMRRRNRRIKKGKKVDPLAIEEVLLKGKLKKVKVPQEHALNLLEEVSAEQLKIRKAWLGDYILEDDVEK